MSCPIIQFFYHDLKRERIWRNAYANLFASNSYNLIDIRRIETLAQDRKHQKLNQLRIQATHLGTTQTNFVINAESLPKHKKKFSSNTAQKQKTEFKPTGLM